MKCDHCGALYIQFHHAPLPPAACVCETERWGSFGNHVTKSSFCMYTILLNECSALGWMNTTFLSPDCFIVFDHCPLQLSLAALDSIAHFRIVFHRWEKWMNNCSDAIMALLYTTVSTNLLHYEYLGQKQWWLWAVAAGHIISRDSVLLPNKILPSRCLGNNFFWSSKQEPCSKFFSAINSRKSIVLLHT